jgi:chromosome segregation protein
MRLKHLELQGYKTFASRTPFAFDGGITAIVGPNGSGKSNIADGIRWVLGEQSYRSLRGKRTEDMIFSGSALRPRLGMASVSLVLDNADGWLPIDFGEVTIARRAYRSGENEYLLNGSRVRLRDITELLSKSGLSRRTYTVIGQGLVDAVLSLRPDDRRELFEEAAGITLYQAKRAESLSRLEETRANLLRVNDIINEIAPRLRRLEREAERAEQHVMLSDQLEGLLRTWYGFRWHQEQQNLLRARDAMARRELSLDRRREALEALDEQVLRLRSRQGQLRSQLGDWHRESGELHGQLEEVQRDLAVSQERARLLARQTDELQAELAQLQAQTQAAGERVVAAEQEVAASETAFRERESLSSQAQAVLDAHEEQRAALSKQMAQIQAESLDLVTKASDRRNRLTQLSERIQALGRDRASHQAVITDQQAAIDEIGTQIETTDTELSRLQAEREALAAEAAEIGTALDEAQSLQAKHHSTLVEAQRIAEGLQARYDLLSRLRDEGEGLRSGVRAVLRAARHKEQATRDSQERPDDILFGILGTVAQVLRVPAEYEVAIELALGGHLQDIVVESWADAQSAIRFLHEGKHGRATFLPLDRLRPASRLEIPEQPGLVGVAADVVRTLDRLAPAIQLLLGRTAIAHDLPSARQAFDRLQGDFQIITLAGEALHSSGYVTGGKHRQEARGQLLAREREWRGLPDQITANHERSREIESELANAQAAEQEMQQQLAALVARQGEGEEAAAAILARRQDLQQRQELADQQIVLRQEQIAQLASQTEQARAQQSSLQADLAQVTADQQATEQQAHALQSQLDQLRGEELYQQLSEARTAAAVARGTWEHRHTALESRREALTAVQERLEFKRQRVAALEDEQASLARQIGDQRSHETVVQGWLASLVRQIEPAEAEMARLEAEQEKLQKEENSVRGRLREAESRHAQALLSRSRQEDRLQRLRQQIMDDFGLVEMEPVEGMAEQPPLPLREMVSSLPPIEKLPSGLEQEIHQIKAQLRRTGPVNPNAPDEYAEALDRYTFLSTQATDLEEAASSLREVISELDMLMRREFHATFKAIAERFKDNFSRLFDGGTARLQLTEPDDISLTGVEIVARPPGKRAQTLALLSGGERTLTAVALIFSILEISPPPFCILDEVDAMLDEANVRRFRQQLEMLSEQTQFIVITHNRGTIQAANTIYGISMGDDSVSQVVSLRLDGDRISAPNEPVVEKVNAG